MENFILQSGFFNQSIVRLPENEIAPTLFTGSNQKKILIVSLVQKGSKDVDDVFLKKIFESVKIDLAQDTSLLSFEQDKAFTWKAVCSNFDFDYLILFGQNLQNIGLQLAFKRYMPFDFQDKQILVAEPLELIAADRTKKGALWNALKSVFLKGG